MAAGERGKAIEEQVAARVKANEELQRQFDITSGQIGGQQAQLREDFLRQRGQTEAGFDPFIQGGEQGLDFLRQTATPGGFNDFLSQITGGGLFQSLRDEQERGARGQLAASGQTGSGLALEELSRISPQLALQLFGGLSASNQNLANFGFQGIQGSGQLGNQLTLGQGGLTNQNLGLEARLRSQLGQGVGQNLVGIGDAQAQGRLGALQAEQDTFGQVLGLAGTLGGAALGGPIGSSLGGGLANLISGGGGGGGFPSQGGGGIDFGLRNQSGNFFETNF